MNKLHRGSAVFSTSVSMMISASFTSDKFSVDTSIEISLLCPSTMMFLFAEASTALALPPSGAAPDSAAGRETYFSWEWDEREGDEKVDEE